MLATPPASRSPVFLEVDVPAELLRRLVGPEAAPAQQLDDARRLRVDRLAGRLVLGRDADHVRVAAQKHVRRRRVEGPAQLPLQLPRRDQLLDVDLLAPLA